MVHCLTFTGRFSTQAAESDFVHEAVEGLLTLTERIKTGWSAESVISVTLSPWEREVWVVCWVSPKTLFLEVAQEFGCTAVFTRKLLAQLRTGGKKTIKEDSKLVCIYSGWVMFRS